MIDRDKVTNVLTKRFPAASSGDIAAAANAIVGLSHEYEAVQADAVHEFRMSTSGRRYAQADLAAGTVRLFRRLG